jgi:predicted MFS family arabinose efflux permease
MSRLVASGVGLGLLLFSPLAASLIQRLDWAKTFLIMGVVTLAVVLPATQFLKRDPAAEDVTPDGRAEPSTSDACQNRSKRRFPRDGRRSLRLA